jgi:hypothetical protein
MKRTARTVLLRIVPLVPDEFQAGVVVHTHRRIVSGNRRAKNGSGEISGAVVRPLVDMCGGVAHNNFFRQGQDPGALYPVLVEAQLNGSRGAAPQVSIKVNKSILQV